MDTIKKRFVEIVSYFFILLFCYASISKIMDFENFQIQIGQSPMLSSFTGLISYGVLVVELLVCTLLIVPFTRKAGLFSSYLLMTAFTVYIYIILNYSEFVPCSCGGILEKMDWQTHLIFNIIFTVVAGLAFFLANPNIIDNKTTKLSRFLTLLLTAVITGFLLYFLHEKSENLLHQENGFIRRFPQHPISENGRYDLGVNSYYFAGTDGDDLYLANSTVPFTLTKFTDFKKLENRQLKSEKNNYNFQLPILTVDDGKVYLYDLSVPVIYEGKLGDEQLKLKMSPSAGLNKVVVADDSTFFVSAYNRDWEIQNLGLLLTATHSNPILWKPNLLEKVKDGYFDPDGAILYDKTLKKLVYVYNYRNTFFTADKDLSNIKKFRTIDTVTVPKLDVVRMKDGTRKLGTKAVTVHKKSAVHRGVLFVESDRVGKYEYHKQWKRNLTIDMYSIIQQKYLGSFYIPKPQGQKRIQFTVTDQYLYVIIENEIIRYSFAQNIIQHFISGEAENLNKE